MVESWAPACNWNFEGEHDDLQQAPDPLLVGASRPGQQQELVTPGSRVVVSDSMSKHFSKKGVVRPLILAMLPCRRNCRFSGSTDAYPARRRKAGIAAGVVVRRYAIAHETMARKRRLSKARALSAKLCSTARMMRYGRCLL